MVGATPTAPTTPAAIAAVQNQHPDAFRDLEIPRPDRALRVGSGSHAAQTAAALTAFEAASSQDFLLVPTISVIR